MVQERARGCRPARLTLSSDEEIDSFDSRFRLELLGDASDLTHGSVLLRIARVSVGSPFARQRRRKEDSAREVGFDELVRPAVCGVFGLLAALFDDLLPELFVPSDDVDICASLRESDPDCCSDALGWLTIRRSE